MNNIKTFLKKRKAKSENMVANDIKIFLSMKSKGCLTIVKTILNIEK